MPIIIYLDMCAASYAALREDDGWPHIRSLLTDFATKGYLVCPIPFETLIEFAPCKRKDRVAIYEFFHRIAAGVSFRSYSSLLFDSTIQLIRPQCSVYAYDSFPPAELAFDDEIASTNARNQAERKNRMRLNMSTHKRPDAHIRMTFTEHLCAARAERCGQLFRDLQKYFEQADPDINKYEIPWIMKMFIDRKLTRGESFSLCELILHHRWEAIPILSLELAIGTCWDYDFIHGHKKRYDPNDEIDRWRAAVALRYADAFLTDRYTASLCGRPEIRAHSRATIFPVSQITEFTEFVKSQIN